MSETSLERDQRLLTESTTEVPVPESPAATIRQVRKRRSTPRKSNAIAARLATVEKAIEPSTADATSVSEADTSTAAIYRRVLSVAQRAWQWLQTRRQWQLASRRLLLCETVSLGEKRFLAIVKVDGQQFLVGGAAASVSMLAQLNGPGEFAGILRQRHKTGRPTQ